MLAAFGRWGVGCFSRLTGDWALALWCERERELFLARYHAGTRTLYFLERDGVLQWSTHLDPFLQPQSDLTLSEEYVARYLSGSPIGDLTPYEGIRSVRPAHYCVFQEDARFESAHWNPAAATAIRYKEDIEYERHFLELFLQAVDRRTGGGAPILAELSGGMDSTSIVCASDFLRRRNGSGADLLDTVSYYDDSEASLTNAATSRSPIPGAASREPILRLRSPMDLLFSRRLGRTLCLARFRQPIDRARAAL